jgi:integrase
VLFLTALRREEVLGMKRSWLDLEKGVLTILPEAEKSGRIRDELRWSALPPQAVALLAEQREALFAEGVRSEYVFATSTGERPQDSLKPVMYRLRGRRPSGQLASQDKRAKKREALLPDDVRIHDIRRTVADALLNRIGAPPWIVDHVSWVTRGRSCFGPTCRPCRSTRRVKRCSGGARSSTGSWASRSPPRRP